MTKLIIKGIIQINIKYFKVFTIEYFSLIKINSKLINSKAKITILLWKANIA